MRTSREVHVDDVFLSISFQIYSINLNKKALRRGNCIIKRPSPLISSLGCECEGFLLLHFSSPRPFHVRILASVEINDRF